MTINKDDKLLKELNKRINLIQFGSVGVTLTIHNGQVTKIEYQTNEKKIIEYK